MFSLKFNKGERTEIGSNCKILANSYIPDDVKLPDYTVWGGAPAKYLGENTESWISVMTEFCNDYYKSITISKMVSKSSI